MAKELVNTSRFSIRLACACVNLSESGYRYQPKHSTENAFIADWLLRLTTAHKRWGFGLCFLYLRNVKGFSWNHKRVYRIYRELELNLRIKPRKRLKRDITLMYIQPSKPTQNAYIERFNRTARHEWLDMHEFDSVAHAQDVATRWLWTYNNEVLTQPLVAYLLEPFYKQSDSLVIFATLNGGIRLVCIFHAFSKIPVLCDTLLKLLLKSIASCLGRRFISKIISDL